MRTWYAWWLLILLVGQTGAQPYNESNDFSYALKLYNEGFYDISAQQFSNFVNRYPGSERLPEARYYLGEALFKLNEIDNARIEFQSLAVSFPEHKRAPQGWYRVGECYAKVGRYEEAAKAFETVKILYPGDALAPGALIRAGESLLAAGQLVRAEQVLREFLNRYPEAAEYPRGRIMYGKILFAKGEPERANGEFEAVLKLSPDKAIQAEARLGQAKVFQELGLTIRAEQVLNAIVAEQAGTPAGFQATLQLGETYLAGRRLESAVTVLRQGVGKYTAAAQQQQLKLRLARAYFLQGEYFQTRSIAQELAASTDAALARTATFYLGAANLAEKRWEEAEKIFQKLLKESSGETNGDEIYLASLRNLTKIAMARGDFQTARNYLNRYRSAAGDDPSVDDLQTELVRLAFQKNLLTAGLDEMGTGKSADHDDLLFAAGKAYFKNRQYERSLIYFEQIAGEYPASARWDSSRVYIDLIKTYHQQSQSSGVKSLARLMGQMLSGQDRERLLFELGKVYLSDLKDYHAAAGIFEQYVNAARDSATAGEGWYYLSEAYWRLAEYQSFLHGSGESSTRGAATQAVESLKQAVRYAAYAPHPDTLTFRFLSSSAPLATTPPDKFIQFWGVFEKRYPNSPLLAMVRLYLADAYLAAGNPAAALAALNAVTRANSGALHAGSARWKKAEILRRQGDTEGAIEAYKSFLLDFPQHPFQAKGYATLAEIYAGQGEYGLAAQFLERLVTQFAYADEAAPAADRIAEYYIRSGEYERAAGYVSEKLARFRPVDDPVIAQYLSTAPPKLYFYAGTVKYHQQEFAAARQNLLQFLKSATGGPLVSETLLLLGKMARAEGDHESAILQLALVKKEDNPAVFFQANEIAADILFNDRKYAEALAKYDMLLAENPGSEQKIDYEGRKMRCLVHLGRTGTLNSLLDTFRKTYSNHPKVDDYLAAVAYDRAQVDYQNKNFDGSIQHCKGVLSKYKRSEFADDAQYLIGRNYATLNNSKKALEEFEKFLKNYPKSDLATNVYLTIAEIHFRNEKMDEGVAALQAAVKVAQTPAAEQMALASIISSYKSLGLWDGALQHAREYVHKFPNARDIIDQKITIGVALIRLNRYTEAVDYLGKLKFEVTGEEEPEIQFYIGEAYFNAGQYEQAINEFVKIPLLSQKTRLQWEASALYYAGQSYEKLGRVTEAKRMYQEIIDRPGIQLDLKRQARKLIDNLDRLN